MAQVTFQIIDGSDKGKIFRRLATPLTIGREEENAIRLNDDRVSRFHVKVQEDGGKIVLTDLESTNGTRVNGEHVRLRVLRLGDQILLGRSLLVFGDPEEIAAAYQAGGEPEQGKTVVGISAAFGAGKSGAGAHQEDVGASEASQDRSDPDSAHMRFHLEGDAPAAGRPADLLPPSFPADLGPAQRAQLIELLEHVHARISRLLRTIEATGARDRVTVSYETWQAILALEMELAGTIRTLSEPAEGD